MTMRLRTLLGDHPGTAALKNGSIKSDLVAFDFVDYSPTNKGFKPMVREAGVRRLGDGDRHLSDGEEF